jgi:carnitine 3-dehydrogenase
LPSRTLKLFKTCYDSFHSFWAGFALYPSDADTHSRFSDMQSKDKQIACVGAGTIGRSWATLFAGKGYDVILQDTDERALKRAKKTITTNFRDLTRFGLVSKAEAKRAIGRITCTVDLREAVAHADFVQESVPEYLQLKRKIFSRISSLVRSDIVIASSTGGLLMSKIQSAAKRSERCVVIHPCQLPVHLTRLVEIVPGRLTDQNTMETAAQLMWNVGKQPLVMKREIQDYITNRLQFTLFREAVDMVGRGIVSAADVDAALCEFAKASFCINFGPFLQAHIHGGPHGLGGIEACMDYYAKILPDTWRSLAKWTEMPRKVRLGVERSVRQMVRKRGLSDKDLVRWRDRSLLALARTVWT